jgi:hypothetical protein
MAMVARPARLTLAMVAMVASVCFSQHKRHIRPMQHIQLDKFVVA